MTGVEGSSKQLGRSGRCRGKVRHTVDKVDEVSSNTLLELGELPTIAILKNRLRLCRADKIITKPSSTNFQSSRVFLLDSKYATDPHVVSHQSPLVCPYALLASYHFKSGYLPGNPISLYLNTLLRICGIFRRENSTYSHQATAMAFRSRT